MRAEGAAAVRIDADLQPQTKEVSPSDEIHSDDDDEASQDDDESDKKEGEKADKPMVELSFALGDFEDSSIAKLEELVKIQDAIEAEEEAQKQRDGSMKEGDEEEEEEDDL
jgi:hypothetical protein